VNGISRLSQSRIGCQSGFGLPSTIIMVVIFVIVGVAGLAMARQELRTQARTTSREIAFYAAETGLAKGISNWSRPGGVELPGTSWVIDQGTLAGGASYRVGATRLDAGAVHALFAIRAQGTAPNGQVQLANLLVATLPLDGLFKGALQVKDSVDLAGTARVNGFDHVPSGWNDYCLALDDHKAGVVMADTSLFERSGAAKNEGVPPLLEDSDTAGFFDFGDIGFAELAAEADVTLPPNQVIDNTVHLGPSLNGDGTCNTSDPWNWGDPLNPGQPCSSWFPIIYARGDLSLQASLKGQGLLLVEGDLRASGGFEFYGPVIVKGSLIAEGGFHFYGGVKAQETQLGAGNAVLFYSNCVLQRALSHTSASKPRVLSERPWFQTR
jgi:hypothetical protein